MDRRVKERLVGASILVVLIVLIVPELLSGPAPPVPATSRLPVRLPASAPEPRNVIVDLGNGKAQATAPASDSIADTAGAAWARRAAR
jgi:cell division septation protein DedD